MSRTMLACYLLSIAAIAGPHCTHGLSVLHNDLVDQYISTREKVQTNHEKDQIKKRIRDGGALFYDLVCNSPSAYNFSTDDNTQHLECIKDLVYFLYATGLHKTQTQDGASEMGITVQDTYKRLYTFLTQYASENRDVQGSAYAVGPRAYTFPYNRKGGYHIVPNFAFTKDTPDFPGRLRALYVAYDALRGVTYIQPENVNRYLYASDRVSINPSHLWERARSRFKRVQNALNTPDATEQHTPEVPDDIMACYDDVKKHFANRFKEHEHGTPDSIAAIYSMLSSIEERDHNFARHPQEPEDRHRIRNENFYIPYIKRRFDHPSIRFGNEIVFGNEILLYAYHYWAMGGVADTCKHFAALNQYIYRIRNRDAEQRYIAQRASAREMTVSDVCQTVRDVQKSLGHEMHNITGPAMLYVRDLYTNCVKSHRTMKAVHCASSCENDLLLEVPTHTQHKHV